MKPENYSIRDGILVILMISMVVLAYRVGYNGGRSQLEIDATRNGCGYFTNHTFKWFGK